MQETVGAGRFQRTLVAAVSAALWPNPINLNCTHTHRLSFSVSLPYSLALSLGARAKELQADFALDGNPFAHQIL